MHRKGAGAGLCEKNAQVVSHSAFMKVRSLMVFVRDYQKLKPHVGGWFLNLLEYRGPKV